jgi:hypothetical protein
VARLALATETLADQNTRRITGENSQERKRRGDIFFFHGGPFRSPYRLRQAMRVGRSIGQRLARSTRGDLLLVKEIIDGDLIVLASERDCLRSIG